MIGNNKKLKKGLTLIELLVSMAIFSFLIVGLIGMFSSAVNAQQSVLQNQEILNQGSYVTEYMDRAIRMALRDDGTEGTAGGCTGIANKNYNASSGSITFLAYDVADPGYKCKRFYLEDNVIMEQKSADTNADNLEEGVPITSSKVKVSAFNVFVYGDTPNSQPIVTFVIDMESNSPRRLDPLPKMIFQTSISQRNLNVGN
ncbi:MAG: prepilin-type N-terminal cleavage/methylation domain-containing protein [Candidatus Pacebacteria bacterium]|nr:prepilin-type N-terminal cleavage/methylation domain-containing protein [Candidatus Paceibacterota bacterium]MDD5013236.1 prepilin-type N-terminal cleavage/methylation domain-containing protein [Candidatus Paceibacterota bacterium]MDD5752757.1 prepilin-type N-terminal cleavage/methylation domain-containing protein [Candidatus Paceibacterota bacterium]